MRKLLLLLPALVMLCTGCTNIFLKKAWPQTTGDITNLPVSAEVEVARDAWGIPHITARSEHDLCVALGFVHAQDRLWQMESLRRLTEGRLAEIAGEKALLADYFTRMIGMPFVKREALAALAPEERDRLQAYADGVNAYLAQRGKDLPLEFTSMGFVPEPWTPLDSMSLLPYMSWQLLFAAYSEELFAVARGGTFTAAEWNDLFPVMRGASLPREPFFDSLARLKMGAINPSTLLFHLALSDKYAPSSLLKSLLALGTAGGGSNNWTVARGSSGMPLLANDPHLGIALPPVWYFCHLTVPGTLNVAGCSFAGSPVIMIGRNEHVAWGLTNVLLDASDMLVYKVDPENPTRYRLGASERVMQKENLVIGLPKGKSITLPLYRTEKGPVITAVEKGVEAVAVLTWYGTLAPGALQDHSYRGAWSFMKATTAAEVLDAGRWYAYASQNLVAADDKGHIGWHAFGAAPARNGYTGRLPADGSAGAGWTGFLPYDSLPHRFDPVEGWLATANNPPAGWTGPPLGFTWAPPYRYERIAQAVGSMKAPGVEDFRRLQSDVHSLQADRLLPKVLALPLGSAQAREAAAILRAWDHEVTPVSAGAALYEVFIDALDRLLLGDRLGDDLALYLNVKMYGIEDEILDRPESAFWDRRATPEKETPTQAMETALASAMEFCRTRMGRNTASWSWGRLHGYRFVHPGAANRIFALLLNRGPFPAPGDNNTVNVSWSLASRGSYDATTIPSMRMIASLDDPDAFWVAGPLGQSGQPGHPHYDDLMKLYLAGEQVQVPLSAEAVRKAAKDILVLRP